MRALATWLALAVSVVSCSPGGPSEDATGQEIYAELCARCHGADLSGGVTAPALGPESSAAGESDEFLEFTVVNGRGRMPSFSSLDSGQLDRLIGYLREVQDDE